MTLRVINIKDWIAENKQDFLPPVCNKMLHNKQLKVMYVGGPNTRKDYHIEEGEEFFYMVKGDMCLKVVEKGLHKDIIIKEGEAFLLPACIPHSPQRNKDTIGLVIERERLEKETDILRYYVDEKDDNVLYEKQLHCTDLGTQLAPIINEYFNSDVYKTGKLDKRFILDNLPFTLDVTTTLNNPVSLQQRLGLSESEYPTSLFLGKHQFDIKVYSGGRSEMETRSAEHWLWQITGTSSVSVDDQLFDLGCNDSLLLPPNTRYEWRREDGSRSLIILQNASK